MKKATAAAPPTSIVCQGPRPAGIPVKRPFRCRARRRGLATPSNVVLRSVAKDCEVDGYRFRRGERALVVFHNMMRQRSRFPHADRFDLERTPDPRYRRLLFGAGPHACLGAGLALAEARQVLGALLALPGEVEIVRRRYNHGKTYPGYSSLRLRLRR